MAGADGDNSRKSWEHHRKHHLLYLFMYLILVYVYIGHPIDEYWKISVGFAVATDKLDYDKLL